MERKDKNEVYLIFVKPIYLGDEFNHYKMFFSSTPEEAIGENWEKICSSDVGNPEPEYIDKMCTFKTFDINLQTLFESDYYTYLHGVYNVISLVYEDVEDIIRNKPNGLPTEIFQLKFGESFFDVEEKMLKFGLILS